MKYYPIVVKRVNFLNSREFPASMTQNSLSNSTLEQRLLQEFSQVHKAVAAQFHPRFSLLKPYAAGGFGILYYAQDSDGNEKAIKIYAIPKKGNERVDAVIAAPGGLSALKQREKYADRFRHPHIVHIHGSGIIDILGTEVPYVEMEWIDGEPLRAWLQKHGPCSQAEFAAIAQPLIKAVALLHKEGIAHLDIKPDNIMLDMRRKNRPVLMDYNNAEETDAHGFVLNIHAGLPSSRYSAPEAESRGELSHRTDIYALGLVFSEILAGKNPQINKEPIAEFIATNIPFRYRAILRKCLHEDPAERYEVASELFHALKKAEHYWKRKAIGTSLFVLLSSGGYAAYVGYAMQIERQNAEASLQATNTCKILLTQEDAAVAQQQCEQALRYNPKNLEAQLFFGHSLLAQGKSDEARKIYTELLTAGAQDQSDQKATLLQALRERGLWLKENEKTVQAIDLFSFLFDVDREQKAAYAPFLTDLLLKDQRYEGALPLLKEMTAFSYESPEEYRLYAQQAFTFGRHFAAQQQWQTAVQSVAIAIVFDEKVKSKRKEEAKKQGAYFQRQEEIEEEAQHHFFLAELYMQSENYALAEKEIKKGNSLAPENSEAFTTLAQLWTMQGKYAEAEEVLYRAVQLYKADIARARVQESTFDEKSLKSNEREMKAQIYNTGGNVIKLYTELKKVREAQGKDTLDIERRIRKVENERAVYERKHAFVK